MASKQEGSQSQNRGALVEPDTVDSLTFDQIETARGCTGSCKGFGFSYLMIGGPCPDPCDPGLLALLARSAKRKARLSAMEECVSQDPDCICANGRYTKLAE